jgi:hypothetical protein
MILLLAGGALAILGIRDYRRLRRAARAERAVQSRLVHRSFYQFQVEAINQILEREAKQQAAVAASEAEYQRQRRYRKFERGASI